MDSYGLYEDLSLFNGDLLPGFPLLADEEPVTSLLEAQDGLSSFREVVKIEAPIPSRNSAKAVLGHPQQGSADLGLADLMASSPTKDLANPLESAWMDTKVDLLDLLTSDSGSPSPQQEVAVNMEASRPQGLQLFLQPVSPGYGVAVVPSTSAPPTPEASDSLDILQTLLSADVKVEGLGVLNPPPFVMEEDAQELTYMGQSDELDLMDLDTSGLEDLLATELDASIENPLLSPVSADDVESLLSSSPPSPGNGLTSFIDILDTSHNPAPAQDDSAYASLNVSYSDAGTSDDLSVFPGFDTSLLDAMSPGPERTAKSNTRSEPYAKPAGRRGRNADRKERKKEQNRSAALKYRQKKKYEKGGVDEECEQLEVRNKELKDKVDSISTEINYLKDLLAEVYKAKGLVLKKSVTKILKKK